MKWRKGGQDGETGQDRETACKMEKSGRDGERAGNLVKGWNQSIRKKNLNFKNENKKNKRSKMYNGSKKKMK